MKILYLIILLTFTVNASELTDSINKDKDAFIGMVAITRNIEPVENSYATCFFLSKNIAITAAHAVPVPKTYTSLDLRIQNGIPIPVSPPIVTVEKLEDLKLSIIITRNNAPIATGGKVLWIDRAADIALLSFEKNILGIQPVKIAKGKKKDSNEIAIATAIPVASMTSSDGVMTGTLRNVDFFGISCEVAPGCSGSPVFNKDIEVIGMVIWQQKNIPNHPGVAVRLDSLRDDFIKRIKDYENSLRNAKP